MRKYDIKNKKYIGIVLGIGIVIVIIFSIFLKKVLDAGKIEYTVSANSVVFDADKNMITTDKEATLKVKWSGNYYMIYDEEMINLTDHAIVYQLDSGDLALYGTFYEVLNTGDVNILKDETIIESSVKSHFYKLDDRKYLIVDRTIESEDGLLVASNYLIVNLDKSGNATFLNNNINLKTFKPKVLKTSSYTFDIANEIINFGGEDIDLKEIIGSTNEYGENNNLNGGSGTGSDTSGVTSGTTGSAGGIGGSGNGGSGGGGGGTGDGTIGAGSIGNSDTNTSYEGDYNSGVSDGAVSDIINATKNTSVIRITTSLTSIGVDYVVYDPNNEYQSVYVELEESNNPERSSIVNLSKNDTNITISDLSFNTMYNLYFKYTYYDDTGVLKEDTFDEVTVSTKTPSMALSVTGIIDNKLYYKITLDNYYTISGGSLNLYKGNQGVAVGQISTVGSVDEITGSIDISNCGFTSGDNVTLTLYSMKINTEDSFNPDISYHFVY